MTSHKNALILIKKFGYKTREVAEVLGIQTRSVSDKMNNKNYNKFSDSDFYKLLFHFKKKTKDQSKFLESFEKIKDLD